MNFDLATIISIILGAALVVVIIWQIMLERRLKKLTRGNKNNSLEEILAQHLERNEILTQWCEELDRKHTLRDQQFAASIKGVGFVRYNPYDDEGPRQSFALALVDDTSNGIILSSISARDKMRIFAKRIDKGQAEQELTTEENEALVQAQDSIKTLTHV